MHDPNTARSHLAVKAATASNDFVCAAD